MNPDELNALVFPPFDKDLDPERRFRELAKFWSE
jgi:hypothetical protein